VAKVHRRLGYVMVNSIPSELSLQEKMEILHDYWLRNCVLQKRKRPRLRYHPGRPTGTSWPVHGVVTSLFGRRPDPVASDVKFHSGIDIYVPSGTPVRAVLPGRVVVAEYLKRYGWTVVIQHKKHLKTLYAHNQKLEVRRGQRVKEGQVIALSGSSGRSTGPHVHYEVLVDGERVDPLLHLKRHPRSVFAEVIPGLE
jgi:murein DD-endopeptidase MepM/ murein hydrolase activator NlpD